MTVSVADIDRWDAGDVREVFHATRSRAEAAFEAADGIATLPAFGTWGGQASDSAKQAIEATRKDLDAHGNEALAVSRAAASAADDIDQVKSDLAQLRADAEAMGMAIDAATSTVVAGPGLADAPPMEIELKREQLQARLNTILAEAATADTALTHAINMAIGKDPIPAQTGTAGNGLPGSGNGQPGQPVNQQSGTADVPSSSTDFLNQLRNEMSQPGTGEAPAASAAAPALDPASPQGKAAADQMRKLLQEQGVPPDQIDARIADVFARAQQPLPAPPKPEPPTKQPAPSVGEQLGDAFNDFTNNVHEGFYDRADQTVNAVQNLTGTGGEGHPGVYDSWKQLVMDNATRALTDPASTLGPANPLSSLSGAAHELPEAINNPGHYAGGKLFDATVAGATLPFGGEGAFGRALLPEVGAVERGALPQLGAFSHDVAPGIPHSVLDPPLGGGHGPLSLDHGLPSDFGGSSPLPNMDIYPHDSWTPFQQSQMDMKIQEFNNAIGENGFQQTAPVPRDPTIRQLFLNELGLDRVPPGMHVDHIRDLQAGGRDAFENMMLLDGRVNMSFGAQMNARFNEFPEGTLFGKVQIAPPRP